MPDDLFAASDALKARGRRSDDKHKELGYRIAALFPVAAQHRGWTVRNLTHNFERVAEGVEETWTCEIVGPRDLYTDRYRTQGGPSVFGWHLSTGVIGAAESTTPDGLVEQVQQIVDTLGIADLKPPKGPRAHTVGSRVTS